MIPFLLPVAGAAALLWWLLSDQEKSKPSEYLSTLDQNLLRLRSMLDGRASVNAAFVGQPGAGKSSLVRAVTGGKCEPLPEIGIGTDATDWSTRADVELLTRYSDTVLVDAPGWDTDRHPVGSFVRHFPFNRFDTLVMVVSGKLRSGDEEGFAAAARAARRRVVVRTYCESLDAGERQSVANDLVSRIGPVQVVFASNRTNEGLEALRDTLRLKSPDAEWRP